MAPFEHMGQLTRRLQVLQPLGLALEQIMDMKAHEVDADRLRTVEKIDKAPAHARILFSPEDVAVKAMIAELIEAELHRTDSASGKRHRRRGVAATNPRPPRLVTFANRLVKAVKRFGTERKTLNPNHPPSRKGNDINPLISAGSDPRAPSALQRRASFGLSPFSPHPNAMDG